MAAEGPEQLPGCLVPAPIVASMAAIPAVLGLALAPPPLVVAAAVSMVVVPTVATVAARTVPTLAAATAEKKEAQVDPLHRTEQTISTLLDPDYWNQAVPWLQCRRDSSRDGDGDGETTGGLIAGTDDNETGGTSTTERESASANTEDARPASATIPAPIPNLALDEQAKAAELQERGFFQVRAAALPLRTGLVDALARGVLRLVELGHCASAISSYDEAWELQHCLGPIVSRITGNPVSGDCYSFYVSPTRPSGFVGAHRDKPTADGCTSFRSDGAPKYVTCWVALTAATPQSSCLHFVAKGDDAGYTLPGDALDVVLPTPLSWQNIVAAPCEPGDLLCFSHRVVHWASKALAPAPPRVALSFAVADPAFETPNFEPSAFPPLALRVGLTAAQAVLYSEQVPLHKYELALNNRIFCSARHHFAEAYADRVESLGQYLKFKNKNGSIAKVIGASRA